MANNYDMNSKNINCEVFFYKDYDNNYFYDMFKKIDDKLYMYEHNEAENLLDIIKLDENISSQEIIDILKICECYGYSEDDGIEELLEALKYHGKLKDLTELEKNKEYLNLKYTLKDGYVIYKIYHYSQGDVVSILYKTYIGDNKQAIEEKIDNYCWNSPYYLYIELNRMEILTHMDFDDIFNITVKDIEKRLNEMDLKEEEKQEIMNLVRIESKKND